MYGIENQLNLYGRGLFRLDGLVKDGIDNIMYGSDGEFSTSLIKSSHKKEKIMYSMYYSGRTINDSFIGADLYESNIGENKIHGVQLSSGSNTLRNNSLGISTTFFDKITFGYENQTKKVAQKNNIRNIYWNSTIHGPWENSLPSGFQIGSVSDLINQTGNYIALEVGDVSDSSKEIKSIEKNETSNIFVSYKLSKYLKNLEVGMNHLTIKNTKKTVDIQEDSLSKKQVTIDRSLGIIGSYIKTLDSPWFNSSLYMKWESDISYMKKNHSMEEVVGNIFCALKPVHRFNTNINFYYNNVIDTWNINDKSHGKRSGIRIIFGRHSDNKKEYVRSKTVSREVYKIETLHYRDTIMKYSKIRELNLTNPSGRKYIGFELNYDKRKSWKKGRDLSIIAGIFAKESGAQIKYNLHKRSGDIKFINGNFVIFGIDYNPDKSFGLNINMFFPF